jgi:uncharacterized protein (TIRG00374 family)
MPIEPSQGSSNVEDHEQGAMRSTDEIDTLSARPENITVIQPADLKRGRYVLGGLVFLVLTLAVFWYQFSRIQDGQWTPTLDQVRWRYLFLMLLFLPVDAVACSLRIWIVCRVLQPGMGLWMCLKAELANIGVSMLTPSNTGGGLGQAYMLNRGGASVGTAISVSLITFLGTLLALLCIGLYSLLFSGIHQIGQFFYGAVWFFTFVSGAMVLGAIWPGLFRTVVALISRSFWLLCAKNSQLHDWWPPGKERTGSPVDRMGRWEGKFVDLIYAYKENVRQFLRLGRTNFAGVCLLSFTFLLSRCLMGFLCLRFLGIEAPTLGQVFEIQLALIFLIYFAPTPGGSGLAEGASLSLMAHLVPIGFVPFYNLLWRFSTLFIPACVGLLFLIRSLLRDTHTVIERRHAQKSQEGDGAGEEE